MNKKGNKILIGIIVFIIIFIIVGVILFLVLSPSPSPCVSDCKSNTCVIDNCGNRCPCDDYYSCSDDNVCVPISYTGTFIQCCPIDEISRTPSIITTKDISEAALAVKKKGFNYMGSYKDSIGYHWIGVSDAEAEQTCTKSSGCPSYHDTVPTDNRIGNSDSKAIYQIIQL